VETWRGARFDLHFRAAGPPGYFIGCAVLGRTGYQNLAGEGPSQPGNRALSYAVAARKFGKRTPSARRRRASASPPGLGLLRLRQFRRTAHALPALLRPASALGGADADKTALDISEPLLGPRRITKLAHRSQGQSTIERCASRTTERASRSDAATGTEIAVLVGHEEGVISAVFSPDGSRIVTVSGDTTAGIWDAATAKEIAVLRGHEGSVFSAAFSPDGSRIVTASDDDTARIWDAATGKEIAVQAVGPHPR
jgi:hypothetical protein